MSPVAATRSRLPRAERERQTLVIASELFAERGYATVTMDDVATAVGVTKPLLYHYFGNKERLYLACMEPAAEGLVTAVVGAVRGAPSPAESLRPGIHAFFHFLDEDASAWRVLFDESLPPDGDIPRRIARQRARITDLVTATLLEQVAPAGRARTRTEVEALSTALLGAAEALGRWWLRTGAITAAEAAELLISTVEPGLRARAADRPRSTRTPNQDETP